MSQFGICESDDFACWLMESPRTSDENNKIVSTVSASVSFTSEDIITYLITYEWTAFKKFRTIPSSPVASISAINNCVCRYKWRNMFHGINLCLFVSLIYIFSFKVKFQTENSKSKLFYTIGMIVAIAFSIITTCNTFGEYIGQHTATLMSIRQVSVNF